MRPSIIIIILYLLINCVVAGTIDPHTDDNKYIVYGSKFNYVNKLCGIYSDNKQFCASAVLIDDFNFLTAAHVVKGAKLVVITLDDGKSMIINNIIVHPLFEENGFGHADIAIGHSEKAFGLDFYPCLYEDSDEVGKICCISGFGINGTFESGAIYSDNKRRAGSNIIDHAERDLLVCSPSFRTSPNRTSLEFLISSGDSGGGLFVDGKLAGINSCVMAKDKKPNSSYSDEGGHTRISKFIKWIKENKYEKK